MGLNQSLTMWNKRKTQVCTLKDILHHVTRKLQIKTVLIYHQVALEWSKYKTWQKMSRNFYSLIAEM